MIIQDIKIGTRLELNQINSLGDIQSETYISQLLEYHDNDLLVISAPIHGSRLVYMPDNARINITFLHQHHNLVSLLGFTALVRSKEFRGNVAVYIIEPIGEIDKIQRRMDFRLDIVLNAQIWLPDPDGTEAFDTEPIKVFSKNLSGSGICLISDVEIPKGTETKVEITLSDDLIIIVRCTVLRVVPTEIRYKKKFELGMRFTQIDKKDQESLIRFIFNQQRLQLKRIK
jgi:c-di-GMP-binding flagellar brake protein YcgR